ncbi:MAG: hypothetical protein PHT77_11475 [Bacteroidales bacterium]|nr:hypothetical protein [Bacteroidales bacterium]
MKPLDKSLYTVSYLMPSKPKEEVIKGRIAALNRGDGQENLELLDQSGLFWSALEDFRDRRSKSRKYERGDQWHELVQNENGEWVREDTLIREQNRLALKHNVIRQLVKNLLGQYRTNQAKSVVFSRTREDASLCEMMTNALQAVKELNQTKEMDAQQFHEHILSGMVVGKVGYDYFRELDRNDVLIENINVNRIFFNTDVMDIRTKDLNLIGEIIDIDMDTLISRFARDRDDEEYIRQAYIDVKGFVTAQSDAMSADSVDSINFYSANDGKCRVYEIWYLKSEWRLWVHDPSQGTYRFYRLEDEDMLHAEMESRIIRAAQYGILPEEIPQLKIERRYEQFWYVKFLTPNGKVLYEGETPYLHQRHPYILSLYPLLDGEVWGLVEDVIDQQRYINRLISLLDYIMGTSAKGLLMVPEESIPEGMSPTDFSDEWTKVGGVIVYKSRGGTPAPTVISSNSTNIGASEILAVEMQLINQLTGINQAIQGIQSSASDPASKYAMMAQHSSMNNRDVIENFHSWIQRRDNIVLQTIIQFYNEKTYLGISGHSYADEAKYYDPEAVKDIQFFTQISAMSDTPVYRQMIDDTLFKLLELQVIDGKMFLENTSLPFADKILDGISKKQEEIAEQAQEAGIDPGNPLENVNPVLANALMQEGGVAKPKIL